MSRSDTAVTLAVNARAAGRLVLLDTFYPGWRAEVDGRRVPIRPADAAFRAVSVGPGRHEVRFSYHPASVHTGALVFKRHRGAYNPVVSDGRRIYLTGYSSLTALEPVH